MTNDMTDEIKQISKTAQVIITLAGVVVALLNIWIVTKLAPLAKDLAVVTTRVEAVELREENFIPRGEITAELNGIKTEIEHLRDDLKLCRCSSL